MHAQVYFAESTSAKHLAGAVETRLGVNGLFIEERFRYQVGLFEHFEDARGRLDLTGRSLVDFNVFCNLLDWNLTETESFLRNVN